MYHSYRVTRVNLTLHTICNSWCSVKKHWSQAVILSATSVDVSSIMMFCYCSFINIWISQDVCLMSEVDDEWRFEWVLVVKKYVVVHFICHKHFKFKICGSSYMPVCVAIICTFTEQEDRNFLCRVWPEILS
jgi:hypothetical protein